MELPLISVCIPAYNAELYLAQAIESAIGQTYENIEIICVDDGSSDNTANIARAFGDKIRFVTIENSGAPNARNVALSMAEGEFIQFLDADNLLLPEKFEFQQPFLQDGTADLVFCNLAKFSESSPPSPNPPPHSCVDIDPFVYCLYHNMLGGLAAIDTLVPLIRASILRKIGGFRPGVIRGQDKDLTFRLAAAGAKFYYIDKVLCHYREHDGERISNKRKPPGYDLEYLISLTLLLSSDPAYTLDEHRKKVLARRLVDKSKSAYRNNAFGAANAGFIRAQELGSRLSPKEVLLKWLVKLRNSTF